MQKICKSCDKEKIISDFGVDNSRKDGHASQCKECVRDYKNRNKERISSYIKNYHIINKEKISSQKKQYKQENLKTTKEYQKEYQEKNKEHISLQRKQYYQKNKDNIAAKSKEYYQENKEYIIQRSSDYRINNKIKVLLSDARKRAKKKGLEFSITEEDLLPIPLICPILNQPLILNSTGKVNPFSPSIDRIVNSLSYIKNNVRLISFRANYIKSDSTKNEIGRIVDYINNALIVINERITINEIIEYKLQEMYRGIKQRIKEKPNLIHENFSIEDFSCLATKYCPVFGTEFAWNNKGKDNFTDNSPSVDRVDNSKGYCLNNIRIISRRANTLKTDATLEELKLIYEKAFERNISSFEI